MGDVELPVGRLGKGGFALSPLQEEDAFRGDCGVTAQEQPEACAAGYEARLVLLNREAGGAGTLGRGENVGEIGEA
jgi:hypothetical protein